MSLIEYMDTNISEYSNYLHSEYDLNRLSTDLNYFVTSDDDFINFLTINQIIKSLNMSWKPRSTEKEVDNIVFKTFENVLDIDCNVIQRRDRSTIFEFISKILRRKPIMHDKHIIILRNYDGIALKFQSVYKTLIERSMNSCFVIGTVKPGHVHRSINDLCCPIRIRSLKDSQLTSILVKVCDEHEMSVNIGSVVKKCQGDLYTSLLEIEKLHQEDKSESTYENLFECAIRDMMKFLKESKSLERVIEKIRMTMNKVLHYSLSDGWICRIIIREALKIPKLKKRRLECAVLVANCEHKMQSTGKKIFIYEYILLRMYEMI